jgi:hypothetical protein
MDSTRTPPRPCTLGWISEHKGYCASALAESTTALRAEMHRTSSSSYRPEPSGLSIVSFRGLLLAVPRSPKLQRLDGARCADRHVTDGNEAASNRASSARIRIITGLSFLDADALDYRLQHRDRAHS